MSSTAMVETRDTATRRIAAITALGLGLVVVVSMTAAAIVDFPRGISGPVILGLAFAATSHGLMRRGAVRVGWVVLGALLTAALIVLSLADRPLLVVGAIATIAVAVTASSYAFRAHVTLPAAARPKRPVLFCNPRSGGGKVVRFHLVDEARTRGILPIELEPGDDLEQLARDAVDEGADALAVAGGDGSQAIVARVAAERDIPYACIPAGTRNHFARDLGVDRDDVVGALDAFVDAGERRVDLGEVNGRTFVNNVSLGVYGEAVQRAGYRDAKLRTMLETAPEVLDTSAPKRLHWRTPDGVTHGRTAALIVSNNPYRLGQPVHDYTRPRLDRGVLGVTTIDVREGGAVAQTWASPAFEIDADGPVHAGIDGEAIVLDPPLRFGVRRGALRCRVARTHPGASPSAHDPETAWEAIRRLIGIAAGRSGEHESEGEHPERFAR